MIGATSYYLIKQNNLSYMDWWYCFLIAISICGLIFIAFVLTNRRKK